MAAEISQTNSKVTYKHIVVKSKDLKTNDIRIQVGYSAKKLYGTNPMKKSFFSFFFLSFYRRILCFLFHLLYNKKKARKEVISC